MQVNDAPRLLMNTIECQDRKNCCYITACYVVCFPCIPCCLIKDCLKSRRDITRSIETRHIEQIKINMERLSVSTADQQNMSEDQKIAKIEEQIKGVKEAVKVIRGFSSAKYELHAENIPNKVEEKLNSWIDNDRRFDGKKEELKINSEEKISSLSIWPPNDA